MDSQLGEEGTALHHLSNVVSTAAGAREARAQEILSLVATVGGVLIGLPALILTLYGTTSILPLSPANAVVLLPLGAGGIIAAVLAAYLPGRGAQGKRKRFLWALAAVVATLVLLWVAGVVVPLPPLD